MRTVETAAFVLPPGGAAATLAVGGDGERLRCASVLKPLVFWAAAGLPAYAGAPEEWERLARDAVTVSANAPTVEAWRACGGEALLDALAERTGVRLPLEPGGERAFGRVLVSAGDVARAYAGLAAADDEAARGVRGWMRGVPERQTFGVRPLVAERLRVPASAVGVKCGWFCDTDEERIRTHVVTLTETESGVVGTAVLTALPADEELRRTYSATYRNGEEVLGLHERHAGPAVRAATQEALGALL